MPIQYAPEPIQPGEKPRISMTFVAGDSLAVGDSLTGTPSVNVYRLPEMTDVTSDVVGPPAILGVLVADSVERVSDTVYWKLQNFVDGTNYKVLITYDTTNGSEDMKEEIVFEGKEY